MRNALIFLGFIFVLLVGYAVGRLSAPASNAVWCTGHWQDSTLCDFRVIYVDTIVAIDTVDINDLIVEDTINEPRNDHQQPKELEW